MFLRFAWVASSILAWIVLLGGGAARAEGGTDARLTRGLEPPLRIAAAASLTEIVEALARDYPGGKVVTSFGASSDLARQIRDGAPVDVFLSASPEWIEVLRAAKATRGEPVRVARNALVCVAGRGVSFDASGRGGEGGAIRDPHALLEKLPEGELVAIADAGVPAGEYARTALDRLGLTKRFESRLVGQRDVRAVLFAVERGEVAAGFVYATDARVAGEGVRLLFRFDPALHPPIEYQAVAIRQADAASGARLAAARGFLDFLGSPAARARLSQAGFVLP